MSVNNTSQSLQWLECDNEKSCDFRVWQSRRYCSTALVNGGNAKFLVEVHETSAKGFQAPAFCLPSQRKTPCLGDWSLREGAPLWAESAKSGLLASGGVSSLQAPGPGGRARCHTAGFDLLSVCCRWADNFVAPGCGGSQEHSFQHPFLQVSVPVLAHLRLPGLRSGAPTRPCCLLTWVGGVLPCSQESQLLLSPSQNRGQGVRCPWKRAEGTVPCRKPAQVLVSTHAPDSLRPALTMAKSGHIWNNPALS